MADWHICAHSSLGQSGFHPAPHNSLEAQLSPHAMALPLCTRYPACLTTLFLENLPISMISKTPNGCRSLPTSPLRKTSASTGLRHFTIIDDTCLDVSSLDRHSPSHLPNCFPEIDGVDSDSDTESDAATSIADEAEEALSAENLDEMEAEEEYGSDIAIETIDHIKGQDFEEDSNGNENNENAKKPGEE
ncbi:hypothetical protein Hypma_006975 [Hypsizygus marmoreus]|uniref:Uncharacterized protein n=1 Tax=Hypsizygus marmoreus TaxID=39966 RepID=A0A369JWR0_HYPMA|nr:hypothetical protein Hypma_006975 [Hypsizygus marmoreus]